jgi:hypothetical protein
MQEETNETKQAAQASLHAVKDKRAPDKCQACGASYKRKGSFAGHVCTPIAVARNNDNDGGNKTKPFKKSDTIPVSTECNTPIPLMGHGFVTHLSQDCLSNMLKNRLEGEFLKGVANSGNSKGVLEMVETYFRQLPALPVPSIQAVSRWLAGRLKRNLDQESKSRVKRNRNQFLKDSIPGLEPTAQSSSSLVTLLWNKLTFKYYICLLFLLLEGCGFAWLLESGTSWLAGCFLCLVGCGFAWCENFVGAVGTSAAVWLVHVTSVKVWLVHVLARLANKA